jgi:uncharacterized protein DUF4252
MKNTVSVIAVMLIALTVAAQSTPLQKIFDTYPGKEGYTYVYVTRAMFDLFETIANDNDDKEFKDITSRLNSIKILSLEVKNNRNAGNSFYREMARDLPQPEYQDLMVINDEGEEIKFITRKSGDKISELIMIVGGTDPCIIALDGDINLRQVAKLSKSMNIKGFEHLNNVGTKTK